MKTTAMMKMGKSAEQLMMIINNYLCNYRSSHLFTIQFYAILQSSYQGLHASSRSVLNSLFFDFQSKDNINRYSHQLESRCSDVYVLYIGDVHKPPRYIMPIIVWMYQYRQVSYVKKK